MNHADPRRFEVARVAGIAQSDIRLMSRRCMEVGGVNLGQGICDQPTPNVVKQAAKRAIDGDRSIYSKYEGIDGLRQAIADKLRDYNHVTVDPDRELLVTAGSTGGFVAAALSFLQPGDEVVLFSPFYGYHLNVLKLAGAAVRPVTLRGPDFTFDPDELRAAFTERTKAVVVNTPSNPCGKVFSRDELAQVAALATEHDCLAITDEIYEYILYDGHEHVSLASLPGMAERTITISGFSKTYNMTGWRLGYAAAPEPLAARMGVVADLVYICAPTPLQHGVLAAFDLPPSYYDDLRAEYATKRAMMIEGCRAAGMEPVVPQGAYYLMADLTHAGLGDDRQAATALLEQSGVAAIPGSSFFTDPEDGRHLLRFCFAKQLPELERACEALAARAGSGTA